MTGPQAAKPRTCRDEYRRQVVDMVTSTGRTQGFRTKNPLATVCLRGVT